jgi:hypothetical protein
MPRDIGEDASAESVAYGLVSEEIKTAIHRQLSLKFWKIKLAVQRFALNVFITLN